VARKYRTRPLAAEFITSIGVDMSAQGLADLAHQGRGPSYAIINGRALYTEDDLNAWIEQLAASGRIVRNSATNDPGSRSGNGAPAVQKGNRRSRLPQQAGA